MPVYKANAYLVHRGKIVKKEEEVELTEEQANRLGEKVKTDSSTEDTQPEEVTPADPNPADPADPPPATTQEENKTND